MILKWNRKNALNVHRSSMEEFLTLIQTEIFGLKCTFFSSKNKVSERVIKIKLVRIITFGR